MFRLVLLLWAFAAIAFSVVVFFVVFLLLLLVPFVLVTSVFFVGMGLSRASRGQGPLTCSQRKLQKSLRRCCVLALEKHERRRSGRELPATERHMIVEG